MTAKKATVSEFPRATRDDILNMEDRIRELVQVPQWKRSIWIRSMTGTERDRYESAGIKWTKDAKGGLEIEGLNTDYVRARLVAMTAVDDDWANLFSERDVLLLGQRNGAALDLLFTVAKRLSGLSDEDVDKLVDGLGKGPSDGSGSDSPETSA